MYLYSHRCSFRLTPDFASFCDLYGSDLTLDTSLIKSYIGHWEYKRLTYLSVFRLLMSSSLKPTLLTTWYASLFRILIPCTKVSSDLCESGTLYYIRQKPHQPVYVGTSTKCAASFVSRARKFEYGLTLRRLPESRSRFVSSRVLTAASVHFRQL